MTDNKQKLELTWIGKNNPEYDIANVEPRILEERSDLSYGDPSTENMIIHGDNLLALKALLPEYAGKVKCIYIDPPYNTGSAFEHYDDSVEHSTWLSLMRARLILLQNLLSDDGSIWINLDDNEAHYFKVMADEVFGRDNFVANVIWEKADSPRMDARFFSSRHDHIFVYARKMDSLTLNQIANTEGEIAEHYNKTDENSRRYYLKPLRAMGAEGTREARPTMFFPLTAPDGTQVFPKNPNGTDSRWRWSPERVKKDIHLIEWVKGRSGWSAYFRIYADENTSRPPETIWTHTDVGSNRTAKAEAKMLIDAEKAFETPKPEKLLKRIIEIASNEGDIVLDSFLGSGTTTAVAHKMSRKYVGIEMGEHAFTHVQTRMKKIVDGTDGLELSKTLNWQGGGGFKFFELAPSFIAIDEFGNPVIDTFYNDTKLIRAMCKLTNYTFAPSQSDYWKQGKGQGNNFIYITTQMLSVAMVQQIVSHLSPNETLLICPKKYEPGCKEVDPRITIKKIPQSILKACQFGKKEYLLPIKEGSIEEFDEEDLSETQE